MTVYPYYVRSLLEDTSHRTGRKNTHPIRAKWLLYVSGPFCLYPITSPSDNSRTDSLCNALSSAFGMDVRAHKARYVLHLMVNISDEIKTMLIRRNYISMTEQTLPSEDL